MTHVPLCSVKGCPAPSDPDWHVPWCGHGLEGHHHHVKKRSQGGKEGYVVFLCPKCHDKVDNGFKYGNAVILDGEGREVYRLWEVTIEPPGKTLIERVIGEGGREDSSMAESWVGEEPLSPDPGDVGSSPAPPAPLSDHPPAIVPAVHYDRRALVIEGRLSWERYTELVNTLQTMHEAVGFWIGDLIIRGEQEFGERAYQPWAEMGFTVPTLQRYAWVCSRIGVSARKAELSFTIHQTVAALEPEKQDELLDRAEAEHLSTRELRVLVKGVEPEEGCKHEWQCQICGATK